MSQDGNVPIKPRRNKLVSELEAIEAQLERKYNTASDEKMSITTSTDDKEARPPFEAEESRDAEEGASKTTSPGETNLFATVCAALDVDSVSQVFSECASEEQKVALMCLIGVPSFAVFAIVNELYHDAVDPMVEEHGRSQCEDAGENYYYSSRLGDRPMLAQP